MYHIIPNKERWLNDEGDDTSTSTDIIIIINYNNIITIALFKD